MLRVGRIDYINCDPLFHGLDRRPGLSVRTAVPSALNRMMRAGELDASMVSSIEYSRAAELYWLFPGVGISASGPIQSVLLLSPAPIAELQGVTIHLTTESATTIVLLEILLAHRFNVQARLEPWELSDGFPAGPVMVIGDAALKARATPSHPHVYDLCEEWVQMTGLPMTFAVFCARRDATAREPHSIASLALAARSNATAWSDPAAGRVELLAPPAAGRVKLPLPLVRGYLRGLEFRLGPLQESGLMRFYQLAHELGALASPARLHYLAGGASPFTREA